MRKRSYGMNDHNNRGGGGNGGRRNNNYRSGGNNNQHFNPSGVSQEEGMLARQRRNAAPNYQKYMNMAREALGGGDRVQAEYYLQHAEHYFRVMADDPAQQQRRERQQRPQHQQHGGGQHGQSHYGQDGQESSPPMPADGAAAAASEGPPPMGPVPPFEDHDPIGSSLGSVNPMPAERYRRRGPYQQQQDAPPRDDHQE